MTDDRTRQSIERLACALYELSSRGGYSTKPAIRMLLGPGEPTREDARHLHSVGISAHIADLLAEAIEQLLLDIDTAGEHASTSAAAAFAATHPGLAADIAGAFTGIDTDALARAVLNDTAPADRWAVNRALDAMFRPTDDDPQEDGDHA